MVTDPTLFIMASLADGDKHGYAMMQDIRQFAEVRLGAGTLYGAITRMEELGWIRAIDSEDRRKPYRLTAAGKRHLEEQMGSLDRLVKTALGRLRHA
jgi:DNA-binding PadR family transcriptional regulator